MKALLLDIGNSHIKWGVLDGETIRRTGRVKQSTVRERGLSVLTLSLPREVETAFVCNVAGKQLARRLSGVIGTHCNCEVHFARAEKQACGVTNGYRHPRELGVDRWVAMIGARTTCQTSCVVVDAGTAVTIDVLDDDGQHRGGQIMPGLMLMAEVLAARTNDIVNVSGRVSKGRRGMGLFDNSTVGAISQGVTNAIVGAIERAHRILRQEGYDPTIILTGGDAAHFRSLLEDESLYRPYLVLQGLAQVLRNSQ